MIWDLKKKNTKTFVNFDPGKNMKFTFSIMLNSQDFKVYSDG